MVNMSRLSDKVAIVTGASKGIRSGIAMALAAAGARVAVNYSSDREGAKRVAQAIIDSGGEAIAVRADVSNAADVAQLFKEVDSGFGRLDVLVNNAAVFRFGAFAEITETSFHVHYMDAIHEMKLNDVRKETDSLVIVIRCRSELKIRYHVKDFRRQSVCAATGCPQKKKQKGGRRCNRCKVRSL